MRSTGRHPLIDAASLAVELGDPGLRVYDCTVVFGQTAEGVAFRSGRAEWEAGHVPGSGFLDLIEELADPDSPFGFMLPSAERFARVASARGIGEGTRAVLYDNGGSMWAARVWWMLRAFGFDDALLLDGGWTAWTQGRHPVSTDPPAYPPGRFEARPRPGLFVGRDAVIDGLDGAACIVNALDAAQFRGEGPPGKGRRPGRIPASRNVPWQAVLDPATQRYLPPEQLRAGFAAAGLTDSPVITYCGGGIAAASIAFALVLTGRDDVAIYDASLQEWASDPALPLETG